jgi:ribonucleotide reductase beta subunit family protein with ferritin-like domain
MTHRWSTLTLDEAKLATMTRLPASVVAGHAEAVAAQRPTPAMLAHRAEQQQWSTQSISLDQDHHQWHHELPESLKGRLHAFLCTFVVGEYTGLDQLGPLLTGSPDEEGLMFLGIQVAEETRHTHLMRRIAEEVLGLEGGLRAILDQAWSSTPPVHRELSRLEGRLVDDLMSHPADYSRWVRAVTLFHLVTEGMLALHGQRELVAALGRTPYLPGIKTGFTAMARDEARHVAYGLHALRQAVAEGYAENIHDVIDQAAPLAVCVEVHPGSTARQLRLAQRTGEAISEILVRQLRQIGVSEAYLEHARTRARSALRTGLQETGDATEDRDGAPGPLVSLPRTRE